MKTKRILATPAALELIRELKAEFGPLVFHQSGGCCDGSSPMCFQEDDFRIGSSDVGLGYADGVAFWMSKDQFEYWKHTQLTLDVVDGRGASFSLEIPKGKRFLIHSRLFTEEEAMRLEELFYME
eukprot:TRINITY_DN46637_c0_g1_i1.p1 TRINITY_DN46637_c0_g1~~TRINITY_DN46637_c0_g1_i1.p1  ORF type:complete len:125 (+),score=20.60 TRINITY_DN46637_c0_g1_i1:118-492(+)